MHEDFEDRDLGDIRELEPSCLVDLIFKVTDPIPEGESPFRNLYPPGENPFEDWRFPSNATGLPPVPEDILKTLSPELQPLRAEIAAGDSAEG